MSAQNIKMLYYDRINVSEEIGINRTSPSKECDVCHYWYSLNYRFKFQPNVCNNGRVAKRSPSWGEEDSPPARLK